MAKKIILSRKAVLVQGGLHAYLGPRLAADAKLNLIPIVASVTDKNYTALKPKIAEAITLACDGKLSADAKLDDMHEFLDSLDREHPEEGKDAAGTEANSGVPLKAEDEEEKAKEKAAEDRRMARDKWLGGKLSAEDKAAWDKMCADAEPENEEEEEKKLREAKDKSARDKKAKDEADPEKKMVSQKAMDEAIKSSTAALLKTQQDIRKAEREVRPWVGDITVACDSASDVYKTALKMLGKDVEGKHPDAYKDILGAIPLPGARRQERASIALDSAGAADFAKRFPNAANVQILG